MEVPDGKWKVAQRHTIPYNRKQYLRMPMAVGLSTSKNSKSSKCWAFCSLWKFKPGANGFKWWDADSPFSVVEDVLDHFC